ncbi:hypothetical protein Tco_1289381, partial [Tanacetum coccineum]
GDYSFGSSLYRSYRQGKFAQQFISYDKSLMHGKFLPRIALQAQSHILPNEIHSININPSCPYQLGFHLDDGLSGVFIKTTETPQLMSEDSAVAAALAFRTFVMICWVEERIVEGSIEGSVVRIQGVRTVITLQG